MESFGFEKVGESTQEITSSGSSLRAETLIRFTRVTLDLRSGGFSRFGCCCCCCFVCSSCSSLRCRSCSCCSCSFFCSSWCWSSLVCGFTMNDIGNVGFVEVVDDGVVVDVVVSPVDCVVENVLGISSGRSHHDGGSVSSLLMSLLLSRECRDDFGANTLCKQYVGMVDDFLNSRRRDSRSTSLISTKSSHSFVALRLDDDLALTWCVSSSVQVIADPRSNTPCCGGASC